MPLFASSSRATPLPTSQIAVLMGVRLAEPIAYTVIFPFINQMVSELGITDNPDKVGFYSGLIESVFAFVQFFTVYHWAKMSDKIGRKPVILLGLTGVAISGSLFGLSSSFWMMIVFRSVSGALNGNVAVIKAAIGDITDESNSTEAFAMYGLTWTVGSVIGNAMGGTLSHPHERFPKLFGTLDILRRHPYLLPCLVGASCTGLGIIFASLFYKESLPTLLGSSNSNLNRRSSFGMRIFHKRHSSSLSSISDTDTLVGDPDVDNDPLKEGLLAKNPQSIDSPGFGASRSRGWSFWELMAFKKVKIMSATMFLNSFVGGAWQAAVLLFFFDKNNGLGMSTAAIGYAMAINGLATIVCQLLLLTRIRKALGVSLAYKVLSVGWIIIWMILPTLRNVLEMAETPISFDGDSGYVRYAEKRGWTTSICVNLYLCFVTIVNMASSLLMVLINFSSPDKTALGAINGISTAVGCMARVIGPSLVSALYAISMDGKVLGGKLWWIFMVMMSCINFIVTLFIESDPSQPRGLALEALDEESEPDE